MNKNIKKVNQKVLLHSLSFAVWLGVCFTVQAQTADTKASLLAQDKAIKAQYVQALQACSAKLAPAQCKRQAGLDFNKAQHDAKLKREALDHQIKRDKHAKNLVDKANTAATAKQGVGADGKPLKRAPLAKQAAKNKTTPQPLSKPSTPNTLKPKERLSKQGKPPKGAHSGGSLTPQPTPAQRPGNVAKFAANEQAIAARKTKADQKKAKRLAKDDARRAAGYKVDKP